MWERVPWALGSPHWRAAVRPAGCEVALTDKLGAAKASPGRHARQQADLPWRRRSRAPLDLRDGFVLRVCLLIGGVTAGLLGAGFSALIGLHRGISVWAAMGFLFAGAGGTAFIVLYLNRSLHDELDRNRQPR